MQNLSNYFNKLILKLIPIFLPDLQQKHTNELFALYII